MVCGVGVVSYVNLHGIGQIGASQYGVLISYTRSVNPVNNIVGCSFVDAYNSALYLVNARGIVVSGNVFYHTLRTTVTVDDKVSPAWQRDSCRSCGETHTRPSGVIIPRCCNLFQ